MKFLSTALWWLIGLFILVGLGYGFYYMLSEGVGIWLLTLASVYILSVVFSLFLFTQKRHEAAKLSWLIIMITMPLFGHIIFFAFGRRYSKRKLQKEYLLKENFKYEVMKKNRTLSEDVEDFFIKQQNVSKRGIYNADYKIFRSGIEAYKNLFKDLKSAKEFIHIEMYIFHQGEIYDEFKSIIIKKASEGVEVKIIVDDFGRWAMPWYEIKELAKKGIKVKIFNKVRFPFISSDDGFRSHRKMFIIDGKMAHIGGMNIGDEYASLNKMYGEWLDFQTKVSGEAVKSISLLFIQDWKDVSGKQLSFNRYLKKTTGGKSQSILVEDSPEIHEQILNDSIVSWISKAKNKVTLVTPYFIPTPTIFDAIKRAAQSGVDVTIYIPGRADKNYVMIATMFWVRQAAQYGVKFRLMNETIVHSKIGLFDDKVAYFGSANIDMRSSYSQLEFISLVSGPVVKDLNSVLASYKASSRPVVEKDFKASWIKTKLVRTYVTIFSPLF